MVQCTRKENQAAAKQTFGFLRDNEQAVCEADKEREVRGCE